MTTLRARLGRIAPTLVALVLLTAGKATGQDMQWTVTVNGAPLSLMRPVTRLGGELYVPLEAVARALGFRVEAAPEFSGLRIRRGSGADTVYDGRTGEIRIGPAVAGQVRNVAQISLAGPLESVLFPLDGLIALLAVQIEEDPDQFILNITAAEGGTALRSSGGFGLSNLDYSTGLTASRDQSSHYTQVQGAALVGGTSVDGMALVSGVGGSASFRQGSITAAFDRKRTMLAGDQFSNSGIDALNASLRGLSYHTPIGGFEGSAYAGRAAGATRAVQGAPSVAQYDSTIAGAALRRRWRTGDLAFGATSFDGSERHGRTVGAAVTHTSRINQVRVQVAGGLFSGLSLRTRTSEWALDPGMIARDPASPSDLTIARAPVDGRAAGISIVDTFSPSRHVSLSGQVDRYGRNFLTSLDDAQFNAQASERVSLTLHPVSAIGVFGGMTRRTYLLGDPAPLRGFNYGASGAMPLLNRLQFGYFRNQQEEAGVSRGPFRLTQYTANLVNVGHVTATVQVSDMAVTDTRTRSVNATLTRDFGRLGQLGFQDQLQIGSLHRYGADWEVHWQQAATMRLGLSRQINLQTRADAYVPEVRLALDLPGRQRLQLAYTGERSTQMISLVFGGPVLRKKDITRDVDGRARVATPATLEGRVYFDADGDNTFTPGRDRPMADVPVSLDEASTVTDDNGLYRFATVRPGAHTVRGDLSAVPADMVFAGPEERRLAILPFRNNTQNFPVVLTGAVMGTVTYLDYTPDQGGPVAKALVDARIIADGVHDTFSDADGNFVISGLPPGQYHLSVDPQTAPAGYAASADELEINVRPGETARNVRVALARPVLVRELPRQDARR